MSTQMSDRISNVSETVINSAIKGEKPAFIKSRVMEIIEQAKQTNKEQCFTSVTPELLDKKLKRINSPMIVFQSWSWVHPGASFNYNVGVYNPDPTQAIWLFAHVWVGSGNIDPILGTFLSNIDTRFPKLTLPDFFGLSLAPGASQTLSFSIPVPAGIQLTNYLGNCCLMQFNWHDIGTYLDRSVFVFKVY